MRNPPWKALPETRLKRNWRLPVFCGSLRTGSKPSPMPSSLQQFKCPGCGTPFSAADVDKKELEPGETAKLTAQINRESIAGPFSKGIFIHSNASNGRIQVVTLNGESVPLVTVLPQDKIYVGTLKTGRSFRQEFILNASEPTVWAKPKITGDIQPSVALEKLSDRQTKVTISWTPEKEYSLFRCAVTLGIESPADWKPVEISLQGRVTDSNDNLQKGQ